jgi:hypothetical protein
MKMVIYLHFTIDIYETIHFFDPDVFVSECGILAGHGEACGFRAGKAGVNEIYQRN